MNLKKICSVKEARHKRLQSYDAIYMTFLEKERQKAMDGREGGIHSKRTKGTLLR